MGSFIFFKNDFKAVFPEIFLIISTLLLFMLIMVLTNLKIYKKPNLSIEILFLAIQISFITLTLLYNNNFQNLIIFSNLLIIDNFNTILKIFILGILLLKLFISINYFIYKKLISFEYIILLLIIIFGLFMLSSSYDLFILYLSIEIISLPSYILTALKRTIIFSTEAGLAGSIAAPVTFSSCSVALGFAAIAFLTLSL